MEILVVGEALLLVFAWSGPLSKLGELGMILD